MEKSKIYLLWRCDDIIAYFTENEFDDLMELIFDLNFEEEYFYFLDMLDMGDSIEEALNYSWYGGHWTWETVKAWR